MKFRSIALFALSIGLLSCASARKSQQSFSSICGYVYSDDHSPLAGVLVSDGVSVVATDKSGRFEMPYDRASGRFVFVSTPSGYISSSFRGEDCFYQDLQSDKQEYNFIVRKNPQKDLRHKVVAIADPQLSDTLDFAPFRQRVADLKEHAAGFKDNDYSFGICLGDMVGWNHSFYPFISETLASSGIQFRYVIGNHDMTNYGRSYETSFLEYEKFFGPTYYSFNVGKVHYVVMDDTFYVGRDWYYIGYLDETQLAWLEKDLALIPKDYKVVLCMHIPTTIGTEDQDAFQYKIIGDNLCNKPFLYKLLRQHDATIWSGHMHTNSITEIPDDNGRNIMLEHNLGGFCGSWWCGDVCVDGCPPGYKVFSFSGTKLQWYYKSCGFDKNYQAKLYLNHPDYPGTAVAHVWDYDPEWKVEYWEDGKKICDMERFTGADPHAKELFEHPVGFKIPWLNYCETNNLFSAPYSPQARTHELRLTDRFGRIFIIGNK